MGLATSGTYNTLSITAEMIIRDAFENIGMPSEFLDVAKYNAAIRGLNLILQDWISKSYNLWTVQNDYLSLNKGQAYYALPEYVSNMVQVNTRTFVRQLDGISSCSSGTAANAFDGNPHTACTQTAPNGNIGYAYSEDGSRTQDITFIGITSNTDQQYTLNFTSTPFPFPAQTILNVSKQFYPAGVTKWFEVAAVIPGSLITMQETGGATLDIQELYFTNNTNDLSMSDISLYNYQSLPQKYQQSRPSCYYLQRNTNNLNSSPILYVWPTSDGTWPALQIRYTKMMEDVTYLAQGIDIPARFYPSVIWALSWRMALKYRPELAQSMKAEYNETFMQATLEDSEDVPVTITIADEAS